jgi:ribosomal protein S25
MDLEFAAAFAAIRDELKARIAQKVQAAGVVVSEEDLAQMQNVILWMTIDPELQEMLLLTALDPVDWARLEPDLPKITQVFGEELAVARAALRRLKDETVTRRLTEERRDAPEP